MRKNMLQVTLALVATIVALVTFIVSNVAINVEYANFLWLGIIGAAVYVLISLAKEEITKGTIIAMVMIASLGSVIFIGSSPAFIADKLSKSLSVTSVTDLNITEQRSVTLEMANKIANKVLGEKHNGIQVSSQYELNLNNASIQMMGSELMWILPLDYAGFFKWMEQDSIPGYVLVSATNTNTQAKLVLDYKIIVSSSAYLMDNIERIVYLKSGLRSVDTHFEIDDNGKPYYISSVQMPNTWYTDLRTDKIFVTDAQTAEITEFESYETMLAFYPWVDRVQSEERIEDRINYYGSLQDGWLNSIFTQSNVNKVTTYNNQELWLVNIKGVMHYFTGMTSVNAKDQSLVSGILVNALSGEAMEVSLSGVMDESGAVSVLDSSLGADSMRWEPVLPMPFFINGEFYWGSSIVSDSGIFQKTGIVKGDDQSKVYFGRTFEEAVSKIGGKVVTTTSSNEMISVKKVILDKILAKIAELEQLKAQLQ